MQTYLDCHLGLLRQSLEAARLAGATDAQRRTIVQGTLTTPQSLSEGSTPSENDSKVHQMGGRPGMKAPITKRKRLRPDHDQQRRPNHRDRTLRL